MRDGRSTMVLLVLVATACTTTASSTALPPPPPTSSTTSTTTTTTTTSSTTTTTSSTTTTTPTTTTSTTTPPTTTTTAVPVTEVGARSVSNDDPTMPVNMRLPVAPVRPFFDDVVASWSRVVESQFVERARALIREREEAARAAAEAAARAAEEAARAAEEAARAAAEAAGSTPPPSTTTTTTTTTTTLPPPPPPPPPQMTVDFDPPAVAANHTAIRLRAITTLDGPPETATARLYVLHDGPVVSSSALIDPDRRGELAELVATTELGSIAGEWAALPPDRLLADVELTADGGMRIAVPTRYLAPDVDPAGAAVVIDPARAAALLSPIGRAIAADAPLPAQEPGATTTCEVRRCVALTFDDGPTSSTERLLDVLDHAGVRATFFVVGRLVEARPEVAARMTATGHAIGNHTWSHPDLRDLEPTAIVEEVASTDRAIEAATGAGTVLYRPPYGSYDDDVRYAVDKGVVLWDVDTRDWQHRSPFRTVRTVMEQVRDGSIVLMHDAYPTATDATPLLIAELRAAGYELVTLPELIGSSEKGRIHYSESDTRPPPPPTTTTTTTTTTTIAATTTVGAADR